MEEDLCSQVRVKFGTRALRPVWAAADRGTDSFF